MSISQEQLKKIAEKLSKIPGDNEKILANITDILSYMELLNEVNTDGVIPTVSVVETEGTLRKDILSSQNRDWTDLIACSHQKVVANQIVLPNIMK